MFDSLVLVILLLFVSCSNIVLFVLSLLILDPQWSTLLYKAKNLRVVKTESQTVHSLFRKLIFI